MEFSLKSGSPYRQGTLLFKNKVIETPAFISYTRNGSFPYISQDLLPLNNKTPDLIHMPFDQFIEHRESIKLFKEGLKDFTNVKDCPIHCSLHDPHKTIPKGFTKKNAIAVWNKAGKMMFDAKTYMEWINDYKPDSFEALYDGDMGCSQINDASEESSKSCIKSDGGNTLEIQKSVADSNKKSKRDKDQNNGIKEKTTLKMVEKSVEVTLKMLNACLEIHSSYEGLMKSKLFGVIVLSDMEKETLRLAQLIADKPVFGFSICHTSFYGSCNASLPIPYIKQLISKLPSNKVRLWHGCVTPLHLLDLCSIGVDLFDLSYAYFVTECNAALILDVIQRANKRLERGQGDEHSKEHEDTHKKNVIYLADTCYRSDKRPLVVGCECMACVNYNRAYIHHLVLCHELLASILLSIHNIHQMELLLKVVRCALNKGSIRQLRHRLEQITDCVPTEVIKRRKKGFKIKMECSRDEDDKVSTIDHLSL